MKRTILQTTAREAPPFGMKIQRVPTRVSKPNHSKIRVAFRHLISGSLRGLSAVAAAIVVAAGSSGSLLAAECSANSSEHRVALLELYTSEGCNSCPPADRWLSGLRGRGVRADQVVPLAFHVDYWDYIGWKDRFASPTFSARQRLVADRNTASFVYTPQFVLDGRDIRRPWLGDNLAKHLGEINAQPSQFDISVDLKTLKDRVDLVVHARNNGPHKAHFYVALFENGLSSEIKAGENAGKRLYHEFVVRQFVGPLVVAPEAGLEKRYALDIAAYGDRPKLGLALFAENGSSGATVQAMALPLCPES